MDDSIRKLLEKARKGNAKAAQALAAALRRSKPAHELLLELAEAPEEALRVAACDASRGRTEPALLEAMLACSKDPSLDVRSALARALDETPDWALGGQALENLLTDPDLDVRCLALPAAGRRADMLSIVLDCLEEEESWSVRETAARTLRDAEIGPVLLPLLVALAEDDDEDVSRAAALSLEAHVGGSDNWPEDAKLPAVGILRSALERVGRLGRRKLPVLNALLLASTVAEVDLEALARHGTDLTTESEAGHLPETFGTDATSDQVIEILEGQAPRGVVFLGEPGTGKTAAVHHLVKRLAKDPDRPWRVLKLPPSSILVGTLYIGEWQTKLKEIIDLASKPRRVLLYVPDVQQLVNIGRSSNSDSNAATMLAPYLESGEVAILGESTPDAFRSGLAREPSFRRLFHTVQFLPATVEETRSVALDVCEAADTRIEDGTVERLIELAGFYRQGVEEPGRSIGLLRRVLEDHGAEGDGPLTETDVFTTVSKSTGIPLAMLDDTAALDLGEARRFFEDRVMGQSEAVAAMLDLVTLIKAGLTDPGKPCGVFLFVGPTGVGKTEMARTLAEFLFGQSSRLKRFDMSEYATFDAFERLLGTGDRAGLLTQTVQEEPFSVILLDEIEKAHTNVFDLCLQIFDAGRLTDAHGQTADFRRAIVILTSNVGSAIPSEAGVGFGEHVAAAPDAYAISRALGQAFRPEFLGRLDRIVNFLPLAVETAERIARRELSRVLERSGIARRGLQVDVDPAVLSLLLRDGYSPVLGARPLKRTVEQQVLMPLARAIAQGRLPRHSIVRLAPKGTGIGIDVDRPPDNAPLDGEGQPPVKGRRELLETWQLVDRQLAAHEAGAEVIDERRAELLATTRAPGFWDRPKEAREVLAEVHQSEALRSALSRLGTRLRATKEHIQSHEGSRPRGELTHRLRGLSRECDRLGFLLASDDPVLRGDAYVLVSQVAGQGASLNAAETLTRMIQAYAKRHDLDVEVLSDRQGGGTRDDDLVLLVSGLGAYALLSPEAGLHQLRHPLRGEEPRGALVRVEVCPDVGADDAHDRKDLGVRTRPLRKQRGRLLAHPTLEVSVIHHPSLHSVTVWTDRSRAEALDVLGPLLRSRAAQGPASADPSTGPVVRRYTLGAAPLVRDHRTGLSTGRLDAIFEGDLDRLRDFSI